MLFHCKSSSTSTHHISETQLAKHTTEISLFSFEVKFPLRYHIMTLIPNQTMLCTMFCMQTYTQRKYMRCCD